MVLAQAVLHIWAENQDKRPPTALDIALFFENAEAWTLTLDEQWNRIGLGLPLSHRLRQAFASFFEACATRARLWALQSPGRTLLEPSSQWKL